jgi:hypothetical protein
MGVSYYKVRKQQLMSKNPYCYWCGQKLVYFDNNGGRVPDNFATIDHLYSKLDGRRFDPKMKCKTLVLSCFKCNQERGKKEDAELGKLERWVRGGKFPRYLKPFKNILTVIWIYKKFRQNKINFGSLLNKNINN